jgi:hypothetical protein
MRPVNPLSSILPDAPAYVRMRTRDQYAYEMRAETAMDGRGLRIVRATLHRESIGEQPIQYARYYVDSTDAIVGVDVLRITASVLFDETSLVNLWIQPGPDDILLPGTAVLETTVHTPGNEPTRLRLTQTVLDISAVE